MQPEHTQPAEPPQRKTPACRLSPTNRGASASGSSARTSRLRSSQLPAVTSSACISRATLPIPTPFLMPPQNVYLIRLILFLQGALAESGTGGTGRARPFRPRNPSDRNGVRAGNVLDSNLAIGRGRDTSTVVVRYYYGTITVLVWY